MVAKLKVLIPESTINFVENPGFRYNTYRWTAIGSTMARSFDYKLYGVSSLKVITNGSALHEGVYYRVISFIPHGVNTSFGGIPVVFGSGHSAVTASAYVRGNGKVRIRLYSSKLAVLGMSGEWASEAISLSSERWTRLEITGSVILDDDDVRLYVETDDTAKAITFYVDGAQIELKNTATTYCDGDQPGCRWNIDDSYSRATRSPYTREGGKWVELSGLCRDNDDIYVTVLGGLGMPPLQHNTQSWAMSAGSYFQNTKVLDRQITILFNVKKEHTAIVKSVDASPLHEMRQQLINIFKPDKTGGYEPFWFSYQEGNREVFIRMRYEAGLEGNWDIRNQWINSFPVRFLIVDPYWVENNCNIQALNFKETTAFSHIAARVEGEWTDMDGGLNDVSKVLVKGKFNEIFAGGSFTKDKLDTINLIGFGQWSGDEWNNFGAANGGSVEDICVTPAGHVYITGAFASLSYDMGLGAGVQNAVAPTIARGVFYPGDASLTWYAVSTTDTAGDVGYAICTTDNNGVFVGGHLLGTFGGGAVNFHNIGRWDGSSWHFVGAGPGVDDDVYDIAFDANSDKMYIGGNFLKNFGAATNDLNYIGVYDYTTNIISPMGNGFNGSVTSVGVSPTGYVYVVGTFTKSGTTDLNHVAKWNGNSWIPLGDGITGSFLEIKVVNDQFIIVTGSVTLADSITVHHMAYWNGSNWVAPDIEFNSDILAKALVLGEDIYLPGDIDSATLVNHSAITEVDNTGTAETFPVVYIDGPGHLIWMENLTTHKRVYFDLTIHDNEEVFIDFGRKKIYSSLRDNLLYGVIQGSDFGDFSLIPGINKLAVFMTNDVLSSMYISYQPRHWSADGTVDAEELT